MYAQATRASRTRKCCFAAPTVMFLMAVWYGSHQLIVKTFEFFFGGSVDWKSYYALKKTQIRVNEFVSVYQDSMTNNKTRA